MKTIKLLTIVLLTTWISSNANAAHFGSGRYKIACDCEGDKVEICHIPPGNPSNAHMICVDSNAMAAHLAHGDYEGPCVVSEPDSLDPDTTGMGNDTLEFEISVAPNPYTGYTTIQYTLSEDGYVLLEVYDQLGNIVQTIVNGVQVAGVYSYQFSAVALGYPPGFYLLIFNFWGIQQNISQTIVLIEL